MQGITFINGRFGNNDLNTRNDLYSTCIKVGPNQCSEEFTSYTERKRCTIKRVQRVFGFAFKKKGWTSSPMIKRKMPEKQGGEGGVVRNGVSKNGVWWLYRLVIMVHS